jgi:hypothetical protein
MNNKLLLSLFAILCFSQFAYGQAPVVTIASATTNTICASSTLTINTSVVNPCATPTFQWFKNNVLIAGATNATYSTPGSTIFNNDKFYCIITCPAGFDTSNLITVFKQPLSTPGCGIATPNTTICAGVSVTINSSVTNGGTAPVRVWKVNGVIVAGNLISYTTTALQNGDVITCEVTTNQSCAASNLAISNPITMTVNPSVAPTIAVTSPNATGCSGAVGPINFTATITNGGTTPIYAWTVNGVAAGTNSSTFSSTSLVSGNVVACKLTSNAFCAVPSMITSNTTIVNVLPIVTPTISILEDLNNTCGANTVNFTASFTNGGTNPSFQWKNNGVNVGTDTSYYSVNLLNNGDLITCVLTSNAPCTNSATATSNTITMAILPPVSPTISISASPGNTICFGSPITYTATITNGGSAPVYTWKVNGTVVTGNNFNTFSPTNVPNGSIISCLLTSNAPCVTGGNASSNTLPLTVKPIVTPTITITGNNTQVCVGAAVSFTSSVTIAGFTPTYQWKVNGTNVGINSTNYNTTVLPIGTNTITCNMTSSSNQCLSSATVTSNQFIVIVDSLVTPDITIVANKNNVCFGSTIIFTATVVNGGATPNYQWKLNNVNVGANSNLITSITLNNNDKITCVLTSNAACKAKTKDTSNQITMIIKPLVTPVITIKHDTNGICANDNITYTVTNTLNGGPTPVYDWKVNGVSVGNSTTTFSSTTFVNGDIVTCQLTSSADCPNPQMVTSKSDTVIVYPPATPNVVISASDTTTCIGTNVTFSSISVDGGPNPIYQWFWNGLPHGANANSYNNTLLETNDSVFVVLTSNAKCLTKPNDTSNAVKMHVDDNITPVLNITSTINSGSIGTPITYTATTSVTPTYTIQWFRNNTLVFTSSTNTWSTTVATSADVVYAKIINFQGCYTAVNALSNTIKMFPLAVGTLAPLHFAVYPNPVQNIATVEGIETGDNMMLYDITGKLLLQETMHQSGNYDLNMQNYTNGFYQLRFTRGNQHWVVKLQKQ